MLKETTHIGETIGAQDLRLEPGQVVDPHAVLLSGYGHQYVLAL